MQSFLEHVAGRDDVHVLFNLLLGRPPESSQVLDDLGGRAMQGTIEGFLGSGEMADIAERTVDEGRLPHFDRLASDDLARVTGWAGRFGLLRVSAPANPSWWILLDAVLRVETLQHLISQDKLSRLRVVVQKKAREDQDVSASLERILSLNTSWYKKIDRDVELALSTGAYSSLEDYFLRRGLEQGRPLLAACTEGLDDLYARLRRREDLELSDVLSATERGLMAGELTHWLFARDHYARMGKHREAKPQAGSGQNAPYVDFLLSGDADGVSCHPLFSHQACRTLNPNLDASKRQLFFDYIERGCFRDERTSAIFDPEYYLIHNADAQRSMMEGRSVNALHHFLKHGIYGDAPFSADFDVDYYRRRYPDVAMAVQAGATPSATWHFVFHGLQEGYQPNPYFDVDYYRSRYPRCRDEMRRLGLASELEHFLLVGKIRNYKAHPPLVEKAPDLVQAKAIFQRRARRSWANILESPLDFRPFAAETPDLSVIFPVSNSLEFTCRALECAFFACSFALQSSGLSSEIVVVDNGSTDGSFEVLSTCPGLQMLRFDQAIGFPRAVNAGAKASRGGVLIIANNDVEFAPDTFANVYRRLAVDPTVGVVGGLTILPNETLQEAGSYVERSGGAVGLGRGQDPWDVFFRGVHTADYCTGSLIGMRRADLDSAGGLDEAFSPGYYEETDLSFRLRAEQGKRSVIDSRIQLNHFEHASFVKGRPPTVAATLMRRNKTRFAAKHGLALAERPTGDQLVTATGVKPAAVGRSRILLIEDLVPDARLGSGFPRTVQLIKAFLRQGVACDVLALHPSEVVDDFEDARVKVYRAWMAGESVTEVFEGRIDAYSHVVVCRSHNLTTLSHHLEQARSRSGVKIICDTEALSFTRLVERRRLCGDEVTRQEVLDAVRLEFSSSVQVSKWIAVTSYEASLLEAAGLGPVVVVGHRNDAPAPSQTPGWATRSRITAVGAIHELGTPNHDALLWFLDRVLPKCGPATRALSLTAVGFWSPDVQKSIQARFPMVDYLGPVSAQDLARLYGETRIALAPTRFAAGLPLKATEAMMNGVPVVVTDLLERQLVGPGELGASGLAVGGRSDDGHIFAECVDRLASDEGAWRSIQKRQFEVVRDHAGAPAFDASVERLLQAIGIVPGDRAT